LHEAYDRALKKVSFNAAAWAKFEPRIPRDSERASFRESGTPAWRHYQKTVSTQVSTDAAGDIFASVCLQRIRLRHDQQVPEWEGKRERRPRCLGQFLRSPSDLQIKRATIRG
jgi:hypothetical protein